MDLKNYKKKNVVQENQKEQENLTKEDITAMYKMYESMTEEELMKDLVREVKKGKSTGTLDTENIKTFQKNVSGFLTKEQQDKMQSLIDMIDRQ